MDLYFYEGVYDRIRIGSEEQGKITKYRLIGSSVFVDQRIGDSIKIGQEK